VELLWTIGTITARDIIDILLVATLFFAASFLFRGTQAVALLRGTLVVLVLLLVVSGVFQLQALRWLLSNSLTVLAVAIPVIFQPELRRALERLGRIGFLGGRAVSESAKAAVIEEICSAAEQLSERRHGALIVLERDSQLEEYVRTGVQVNGLVSTGLLLTVFWPKTELHDGAAIVDRMGKLASAAAVLPLSASRNLRKQGLRHRAALGITEVSDAVCVVVSEETGRISVANGGRMISRLDTKRLRKLLTALYGPQERSNQGLAVRTRQYVADFVGSIGASRAQ
jgi:diadenylate cyclase